MIPSDAGPLVARGVLDKRLFDVTQLLSWGYGDADRKDIPLITESPEVPALRGAREPRALGGLGMTAFRVAKTDTARTWQDLTAGTRTLAAGKPRLWLDGRRCVGAVDGEDQVAPLSNVGPRQNDHAFKPDVTAPGIAIVAAKPGGSHVALSGTSMAAPHVAGAAAILAQRHPDWSGQRLKAALAGSARPAAGGRRGRRHGHAGQGRCGARPGRPGSLRRRRPRSCELRAALPAEKAAYTLTTSMSRRVPYSALSTEVRASWTFLSSHTEEARALPLMAVRFAPAGLDGLNRARPGSVTRVPLWAERNPGAQRTAIRWVRLESSVDDGRTRHWVTAVPTGEKFMAVRFAPAGLDGLNRARPGSVTRVPLWAERNPGAQRTAIRWVRLESSVDDGRTRHWVTAVPTGEKFMAVVPNPRTPGFVSLRVTAADGSGTRLTQTITRAWAVG
ncbi:MULTISPECIES: S8 family serine peptidase [unclassified Nonomuraea]|uniref:S8 family serine peptidase n=1 Tax=unclassified Nonomuraea TaxID=2593643 RepID=UPI0034074DCB